MTKLYNTRKIMTTKLLWSVAVLHFCSFAGTRVCGAIDTTATTSTPSFVPHDAADLDGAVLIDWLVQKHGGVVSDKITLRKVPRGAAEDGSGGWDFGFFATEDIEELEILMTIPISSMVSSTRRKVQGDDDNNDKTEDDQNHTREAQSASEQECQTLQNMLYEYQKGEKSKYYPYMKYIFEGYGNMWGVPLQTWSDEGKDFLLDTIVGSELPPERHFVESYSYTESCERKKRDRDDDDDDEEEEQEELESPPIDDETRRLLNVAYIYFLARSRGDAIIPLYDMIHHRNGDWRTVDAQMIPEERSVIVYAYRDIQKGERLYTSMNECDHMGCEDLADTYMTPHMFSHFGVLEDYPRRWVFGCDPDMSERDLTFDLDQIIHEDGSKELTVYWRLEVPDNFQINWIKAQLFRFQNINATVYEQAAHLDIAYERDTSLQFYEAYKEAFQAAWENRKRDTIEDEEDIPETREYDSLQESRADAVIPYEAFSVCTRSISSSIEDGRREIGHDSSHYQEIRFTYTESIDVTTLSLSGWIQTATNFRPHYHEPVVHVAAQYVKDVKRVAFLGGGDNMLLHEIMKYKDLELVVGIELDQKVSRLSFKHFGNSPFFDDPRIHWWFGDASKAINVLPTEYFGSFDIVIVDLLTYIAETIKVQQSLSLLDAAALLMKKNGGVILRNEDFSVRSHTDFAKYTVDLDYLDMPFLCEQSITLGSDSIDFMNAEPIDHGIDVLARPMYFKNRTGQQNAIPYEGWKKYRNSQSSGCKAEADSKGADPSAVCDEEAGNGRYGVLTIIEAEHASRASESTVELQSKVAGVMSNFGFSDGTLIASERNPNVFTWVFEAGYVTTRVYNDEMYISFDLAIWENFNIVNAIADSLVDAVGGSTSESTTSFKVVTSGMPMERDTCSNSFVAILSSTSKNSDCLDNCGDSTLEIESKTTLELSVLYEEMLKEMIPDGEKMSFSVMVLCGKSDFPCTSIDSVNGIFSASTTGSALAIYPCSSFEDMPKCELETIDTISSFLKDRQKFDAIILDDTMPREMGQVIHKIFNETSNFDGFLREDLLVLSPISAEKKWRSELVDRFRTEMALLDPAFRSDFVLSQGDTHSRWNIFSSVRDDFFHRFTKALSTIVEKSNIESFTVLEVENGMKQLIAAFQPSSGDVRDSDYDKTEAAKQWNKQVPLAYQTIIQMAAAIPQAPLEEGELIMVEVEQWDDNPFFKEYEAAEVIRVLSDKSYYVKALGEDAQSRIALRPVIRKMSDLDDDVSRVYHVGDVVLYNKGNGVWINGAIEVVLGDNMYSLYQLDYHKTMHRKVPGEKLLLQAESDAYKQPPAKLQLPRIVSAFSSALGELLEEGEMANVDRKSFPRKNGSALETAFWPGGQAILKFDGSSGVEINLFLNEEHILRRQRFQTAFLRKMPDLAVTMLDEFPRGYGGVVSMKKDMETPPHWLSKYET